MGAVYKARQPRLNRLVALKILVCPEEYRADFALRFEREAQVLARLSHPHIVAIYDFGEVEAARTGAESVFYFLMEYVDGQDLAQMLRSRSVAPEEAYGIARQVCEALQYAHEEGITHRDIKPGNLLIDRKGRVKVADFGLAKLIQGDEALTTNLTVTGTAMGTPHYMAPEQWEEPETVDHRADIYALGVVCYEMVTGERPVGRYEPPSKRRGVDRRMDTLVDRALQKDRDRRYSSVMEMKAELDRLAPAGVSKSGRHRKRWQRAAILIGVAALLGWGSVTYWQGTDRGRAASAFAEADGVGPDWDPLVSRSAAERAIALGASVGWEQEGKRSTGVTLPGGDFRLVQIRFLPRGPKNKDLRPSDVLALLGARELESLDLQECSAAVDERVAEAIGALPVLNSLGLQQTNMRDEWMEAIARAPQLKSLSIAATAVTDVGVEKLSGAALLRDLSLTGCQISGAAIARMPQAPDLERLGFGDAYWPLSDGELIPVVSTCRSLSFLFVGMPVSPAGLEGLKELSGLATLKLGPMPVSRAHLETLAQVSTLQVLALDGVTVEETAWEALPAIRSLRQISLVDVPRTPAFEQAIQRFSPPLKVTGRGSDGNLAPADPSVFLTDWDPVASRRVAEQVIRLGGEIGWEQDGATGRGRQIPTGEFRLQAIAFPPDGRTGELRPADLIPLLEVRELEHLSLHAAKTGLSAEFCQRLAALPRLRSLMLQYTNLQDEWLTSIGAIQTLESLNLAQTKVSEVGIGHLAGLPRLQTIHLSETRVTGNAIARLPQAGSLREVNLGDPRRPADDDLRVLAESSPELEVLTLGGSLTGGSLAGLGRFQRLLEFSIRDTELSAEQMGHIAELPVLSSLKLVDCVVSDDAWTVLPKFKRLAALHLLKGTPQSPALNAALARVGRPISVIVADGDEGGVGKGPTPTPSHPSPGQWIRPFQTASDINPIWIEAGAKWEDGWLMPGPGLNNGMTLAFPNGQARNWGVRATYRWHEAATATLMVRRSGSSPDNSVQSYHLNVSGGQARFRRSRGRGAVTGADVFPLGEPVAVNLKAGQEVVIAIVAIGDTLYGKVGEVSFQLPTDGVLRDGNAEAASTATAFRDIEFINLDTLSDADARRLAGLPESP